MCIFCAVLLLVLSVLSRYHRVATSNWKRWRLALLLPVVALLLPLLTTAQTLQKLQNHVAPAVQSLQLKPLSALPSAQTLQLNLVLPLRNQSQLQDLLTRLYDPSSADYHHFLSVDKFTAQFGPTESDYQSLLAYAAANGFSVTSTAKNRRMVSVQATVAQVNSAFHLNMYLYQHPTESRTFYSADREPTVALSTKLAHIDGLNNYSLPKPMIVPNSQLQPMAVASGSGPGGSYLGSDMRAAYYGGSVLTGATQTLGVLEFGGYYSSDVDLSFSSAGQSYDVPIVNVLVGTATNTVYYETQESEVVLDIVQAIGMAPGLDQLRVYIGDYKSATAPAEVLNQIASENKAKQIGCSWSWIPGDIATDDSYLQEMAAQGQSFFVASGDHGAFDSSIFPYFYPQESKYVTAVGGTHLTTVAAGGAWSAESAWNSNSFGSGGGVSPDGITIPSWQSGISNSSNNASTSLRNVPDVAMEGDFDNFMCAEGGCYETGAGTSYAAPRWAGFMALVNQQAVENGSATKGGLGLINSAIYTIGKGSSYTSDFHDVQSGNNDTDDQTTWYSAVSGYDLVTGWGSPSGQSLIDALAGAQTDGFWLSASSRKVGIIRGQSGTTTINVTDAGSFSGNVNLSITSTLPTGVTASWSTSATSTSSVLTLTTTSSAAQGTYPVTITGTSGSITQTVTVNVVVEIPSFTLSTSTNYLTITQGSSQNATITVNDLFGFSDTVNLTVSGLPSGVTASWSANSTGTSSVLTLTASSTAAAWSGAITVTGTSGSLTSSTSIYLTTLAPYFTLYAPSSLTIGQGAAVNTNVLAIPFNGFSGNVTFTVSGLPSGVTAAFSPNPTSYASLLSLTSSSAATAGSATVTITGTSGSLTASTTLTLTVSAPTFTLNNYCSLSLPVGSSSTCYINVSGQYGFSGKVSLAASGLPSGVTASFGTNPATSSSVLTLTADSTVTAGSYTVTVTGTSGSQSATTTVSVNIGTPDFTLSTSYSLNLAQSGTQSTWVIVSDNYGFNSSVSFSASGVPSGVTASFSPVSSTYQSTLTLTAASTAVAGTYTVTITGTSGSISRKTTLSLTIVAPTITTYGGGPVTLGQGSSADDFVYVEASYGFSCNANLTVTGLPSGVTGSFSSNPMAIMGGTGYSTLTLTATTAAVVGTYTAQVTASCGSVSSSSTLTIYVATPGFTLSSYGTSTIGQGGSGTSYVYVVANNGFSGSVSLAISGLPNGITVTYGANPTTYVSVLTLNVANNVATGTYTGTITGTSGSLSATTTITIVVVAPSFTVTASDSMSVNQGTSASAWVCVYGQNSFSGQVTLSSSGLPTGVTTVFATNPISSGCTQMVFSADATSSAGTSTVTITGTSGSLIASTSMPLTVSIPSFTLSATPSSVQVAQGGSHNVTIAIADVNGFASSVNLSVTGLPAGVTGSFAANPTASSTLLTLTADSSATPSSATATITGTSGSLTQTLSMPVKLLATPASTTTTLALTSNGSAATTVTQGAVVELTATVSSGGTPLTTGLVSFCDASAGWCGNTHLLGVAQITGSGTAVLHFVPPAGAHSYRAVYASTIGNASSHSDAEVLTVTADESTTTTLAASGDASGYSLTATVVAAGSVAPTGSVSFLDADNKNAQLATASLGTSTSGWAWSQPQNLPTGNDPVALALGDFNGDGWLDVAVVDSNSNAINILQGNSDGSFTVSPSSPQIGNYPLAITTGDFNQDGTIDLAVLSSNGTVSILLGAGDGTFTVPYTYTNSSLGSTSIAAGDFNQDGITDLVVTNSYNNTLTFYQGKGDGTFTPSASGISVGSYPKNVIVADLNGDGIPDLVVGNTSSSGLYILLGNGDGTFSAKGSPLLTYQETNILAIADFNGDGVPDIAVTSTYSTTLNILLGKGDGTFTATAAQTIPYYSTALAAGDFNGDGNVDLLVAAYNQSGNTVLLGKGDGTFTAGGSLAVTNSVISVVAGPISGSGTSTVFMGFPDNDEVAILQPTQTQTATAAATSVSAHWAGQHLVEASYAGDSSTLASVSSTTALTGSSQTPTITWANPNAIVYGTALSSTQLNATANVPGSFAYTPAAGTVPGIGTQTLSVLLTPNDSTNYTTATATVSIVVNEPVPALSTLSSVLKNVGAAAFTLTADGSGFTSDSKLYWGTTALTTQYVSATELTAAVPSTDLTTAGNNAVTVQNPTPGGGTSNAIYFDVVASSGGTAGFTTATASVSAGSSASYPVTLDTNTTAATVSCLNLPSGATCSYTGGQLVIATSSTTPSGTYQVIAIFTETITTTTAAWFLLPFGVLPLLFRRGRMKLGLAVLGLVALSAVWTISGCGGGSQASGGGTTTKTTQSTATGTVTLTVK